MMLRKRTWILLLIVFGLRLLLQGWDAGVLSSPLHPDERQVGFVTAKVDSWFTDPEFYAYGSLHFQAVRSSAAIAGLGESLRGLVVGGRALSLAASMLAIILGWLLAHRAWGRRTGEVFLLLVAWVPLDLQQSHFCTVEAHHTAWILLALAACYWLASSGKAAAASAAGAFVGASLAVKVASLALGLPLVLALVIAVRRLGVLETLRLAAITITAGIATFWLCQPWAFVGGRPPLPVLSAAIALLIALHFSARMKGPIRTALFVMAGLAAVTLSLQAATLLGAGQDSLVTRLGTTVLGGQLLNPSYLRGVGEQVAMVMGNADLPYVRVYAATLPILYPLRELALWGFGPMLLLAAIAGAASGTRAILVRWRRWLAFRWNDSSILLVILLAWLVPMAVRLGTLQVKYLRYWEPLVVPAALIAAWWLTRFGSRLRRRATVAVAAGTVLWGLAYLWAFADPHPHGTASRWLSPMVSDGQVVAFENWDESIALEPVDGRIERINLPSYDLPDDDAKALRWCEELARADWVVLTSNRVFRTILANPDRFPQTARLYKLLLTGEAGFEPSTRARRGPHLFGLRWPVQTADESFVNYDFPQVLIFRRTAEIDSAELAKRVRRPIPYLAGLGFRDLNKHYFAQLPSIPAAPSGFRQTVDVLIWLLVFTILGLAAWLILFPILRPLPDAGIGLALATGWIAPAWLMWLGSELSLWSTNSTSATWLFLGISSVGAAAYNHRREELRLLLHRRGKYIVTVVAIAVSIGALFLVVRAFNPAIFWGEKPMDFSFLNAFLRAGQWPPGEPWMAGMPLHYYYFGEVLSSFPILLTGCTAGVGYNLMAATIPALSAAILAGFSLVLARRRRLMALTLPLLILLTGNLAWPWLLHLAKPRRIFDLWWATSRVLPGASIDEYPLWTTLFADLHGHFIALPVLLAAGMWGWLVVRTKAANWIAAATLCGISTAALVATNPWDIFILTAALGAGVIAAAQRRTVAILRLAMAAALSLLAAAPFIVELIAGFGAGAGQRGLFLTDADFAPAWAVIRHFGLFLIPLGVLALATLGRRWWLALPIAGAGVAAGLVFGSTAAALGLGMGALFTTSTILDRDRLTRFGWSMATIGAVAIAACERFTLIDRMNTVFKIYNGVWVVLALALGTALLRTSGRQRRLLIAIWAPIQLVALINLPIGIAQGWMQPRIESPTPSLDGQAFLSVQDPQTWFLAHSLQGAARPDDAIAEASGPSYGKFTRIAMHTGQPTVLGWHYHLMQRGQSQIEISARSTDLETLFNGRDQRARRAVLDRYRIQWVVVGDLERERYQLTKSDPLAGVPGLLLFAEHGDANLYRVLAADQPPGRKISPAMELPRGTNIVGQLPQPSQLVVRSLDLDDDGATVVDRTGSIIDLDLLMREPTILRTPSCEVSSAVRFGGGRWALCVDGNVWQLADGQWFAKGRVTGAARLTADETLWAWGEGGLWRFDEGQWHRLFSGAVTAASARGPWVAWSDGTSVLVGRGERPRRVPGPLEGIRSLGWEGTALVAIDATGIHRSGGSILPWRKVLPVVESIAFIAGNQDRLWLVREDGLILESEPPSCSPLWKDDGGRTGTTTLREPRGLVASPKGWFAVADTLNHRVLWYSEQGVCIDSMGSEGTVPGAFQEPSGLALSHEGALAITDTWNGRVQLLGPDGSLQIVGRNLFGPRSALWAADGSLVVSDTGNKRILRFSPPSWQQEVVVALPAPVVGLASVSGLLAAAVPAEGAVFLVDHLEGTVVRRLDVPGWSERQQQEGYLALLPSGDLAASAPKPGQVWLIDPAGSKLPHLLRDDLPGITGLTLLPDGQLLGALTWEHRLVKIEINSEPEEPSILGPDS